MRDMFGHVVTEEQARVILKRRDPEPKGYVEPPGTGPEGETCATCAHISRQRSYSGRSWAKCGLAEAKWTGGRGSDIRARAPACRRWTPRRPEGGT